MYGRATRRLGPSVSVSAGLGIVGVEDDMSSGLVLAAEAFGQLPAFGVGLYGTANICPDGVLAALIIGVRFGKLW